MRHKKDTTITQILRQIAQMTKKFKGKKTTSTIYIQPGKYTENINLYGMEKIS